MVKKSRHSLYLQGAYSLVGRGGGKGDINQNITQIYEYMNDIGSEGENKSYQSA